MIGSDGCHLSSDGYWLVASDGYWLVASDGGIFTFGDAGTSRLNRRHPLEPAHRRDVACRPPRARMGSAPGDVGVG